MKPCVMCIILVFYLCSLFLLFLLLLLLVPSSRAGEVQAEQRGFIRSVFVEGLDLLAASALDGKICESGWLAGSSIVSCYIASHV